MYHLATLEPSFIGFNHSDGMEQNKIDEVDLFTNNHGCEVLYAGQNFISRHEFKPR
jgi:hypothetical protein